MGLPHLPLNSLSSSVLDLAPTCPDLPRLAAPTCPYLPRLAAPTCRPDLPRLVPTCPYLPPRLALLYRYFHGECSDELQAMVPPVKAFPRNTRLASSVTENHHHFLDIPFVHRQFHAASFFPRTALQWNTLPSSCFPDSCNLKLFKSRVNRYLSSLLPAPTPS